MGGPKQSNINKVIAEITDRPLTIPVLSDDACLSVPTVQAVIRLLRAQRSAYIETWIKIDAGAMFRHVAAYRFGSGRDVPRPQPQTPEERRAANREYKRRQAGKKARATDVLKREALRKELDRPAFRHPQDVWLFGPAPRVWSSAGKVETRVYLQSMGITEEEGETV